MLVLLCSSCKNDDDKKTDEYMEEMEQFETNPRDSIHTLDSDLKALDKSMSIELKQNALIEKKDERNEYQKLILDKRYVMSTEDFRINFKYPLLDTGLHPKNKNFNDFINTYYVNVSKTISDIEETKMVCDSITANCFREERFIDYKIYIINDQLVSILFYKENFYSEAMHPSYSFDCFNFNLNKGVFMTFEDFFVQGSEDELLSIMNNKIKSEIQKGNIYYDCWEVSSNDFLERKNNFVINDTYIEYYFDDCVMCPSYTGTYSIELPLTELMSVLKKSNANSLVL